MTQVERYFASFKIDSNLCNYFVRLLAEKQSNQGMLTTTQAVSAILAACIFGLVFGAVLAHKLRRKRKGKARIGSTNQQESPQNNWPGIPLRASSLHSQQNVPSVPCSPISTKAGEQHYENVAPSLDNPCGATEGACGFDDGYTETPLHGDRYSKFPEDCNYENVGRVKAEPTQPCYPIRPEDEEEGDYENLGQVKSGQNQPRSSTCRKDEKDENRYTEMPAAETYINFPNKAGFMRQVSGKTGKMQGDLDVYKYDAPM